MSRMGKGSSPHTRGARRGWIPLRGRGRDHPRIRGEHKKKSKGKVDMVGIIPAYAGSTSRLFARDCRQPRSSPHTRGAPWCCRGPAASHGDHPRIRGEHQHHLSGTGHRDGIIPAYAGSTHVKDALNRQVDGIIPAYAGSTVSPFSIFARGSGSSPHTRGALHHVQAEEFDIRDHPRIRGEHAVRNLKRRSKSRIIPAYAGST